VTFHGYLEHRELRPIVESADIAVISSRHEAGPLFVLEAAVAGVPTVGTNVGHVHEWAESAALAVDCQDAESLASQIALLLSDEPMRQRLAYEAQARAVTEDATTTARLFGELYSRLSEDKSTRV
jgi:glycosyltransferase involved in cell wall biosynthesis